MGISIRSIELKDLPTLVELLREFAEFEDLIDYHQVTEERLFAAMFDSNAVVEGLMVLDGDLPVGYALYYPSFSSFRGQRGLYLEDIYINEKYRGHGIGERLVRKVAGIAAARGCERLDFLVLEWNERAIKFYERLGAARDDSERHLKFTDQAFRQLAETAV
jgi:ribosomal protein S18 acetylase RimI-like enzyme